MIEWTIEAALESSVFEHVLIFTDDEHTAELSRAAGADVPFLREAHVDDHSPVSLATCAAVERAETHWDTRFDVIVQLMANCPLRSAADIRNALAAFEEEGRTFQISACRFGWMNPWWAARVDDRGRPEFLFPDERLNRSQDLPELYFPTGAIWVAERDALLRSRDFYGSGFSFHELPWTSGVDVDDVSDLRFAESVAQVTQGTPPRQAGDVV